MIPHLYHDTSPEASALAGFQGFNQAYSHLRPPHARRGLRTPRIDAPEDPRTPGSEVLFRGRPLSAQPSPASLRLRALGVAVLAWPRVAGRDP